jgi:hypothetical protein
VQFQQLFIMDANQLPLTVNEGPSGLFAALYQLAVTPDGQIGPGGDQAMSALPGLRTLGIFLGQLISRDSLYAGLSSLLSTRQSRTTVLLLAVLLVVLYSPHRSRHIVFSLSGILSLSLTTATSVFAGF